MTQDKLVLTHRGALTGKYGAAGCRKIDAALRRLVRADLRRGIDTVVIALDDPEAMSRWGGPVPAQASPRDIKQAIDRLCRKAAPHYLMLLGGPDVVPMVPLVNPAYSGAKGDPDKLVPSDLPYACEAPYSTHAGRFLGASRVLGRLPDVVGAREPSQFTLLIDAAARSQPRPPADYAASFGITAQAWTKSTQQSLKAIVGHARDLHEVPDEGPRWSKAQLAARVHFINCHGADASAQYFGQPSGVEDFPVAHQASLVRGRISAGTVLAVECCYGAQLYDPADAAGQQGIALTYLQDGAAAVFGSTTIAYGPSEGNSTADLITQQFLQQVLAGASTGRAALEARQKFAGGRTHLDPYDLKTLAQFYLLGDPSLHPVAMTAHALNRTRSFKKAFAGTGDRSVRGLRRERLQRDGKLLAQALPRLVAGSSAPAPAVEKTLTDMVRETGLPHDTVRLSFDLQGTRSAPLGGQRRIHVVKGLRPMPADPGGPQVVRLVALVATEQDGELIHVRRLHAR